MKILDKIDMAILMESVANGTYFFKDVRKPKAADRIRTQYDGSQFIGDTGRMFDEIYEATSITVYYNGKRTNLNANDILPGSKGVWVCIVHGYKNYEWKFLY